jgi:hypothetical protein
LKRAFAVGFGVARDGARSPQVTGANAPLADAETNCTLGGKVSVTVLSNTAAPPIVQGTKAGTAKQNALIVKVSGSPTLTGLGLVVFSRQKSQ